LDHIIIIIIIIITALQVGRSRGWFLVVSLAFSVTYSFWRTMTLGLTQPLVKMSTRNISWG